MGRSFFHEKSNSTDVNGTMQSETVIPPGAKLDCSCVQTDVIITLEIRNIDPSLCDGDALDADLQRLIEEALAQSSAQGLDSTSATVVSCVPENKGATVTISVGTDDLGTTLEVDDVVEAVGETIGEALDDAGYGCVTNTSFKLEIRVGKLIMIRPSLISHKYCKSTRCDVYVAFWDINFQASYLTYALFEAARKPWPIGDGNVQIKVKKVEDTLTGETIYTTGAPSKHGHSGSGSLLLCPTHKIICVTVVSHS